MDRPRFLLDENVDLAVAPGLRDRGIDAVHLRELGMTGATDDTVLEVAARESRIVVTRDLKDFARLGTMPSSTAADPPGVLLVTPSISPGDPGALIRAIAAWEPGCSPQRGIAGGIAWLMPAERSDGEKGRVRERPPAYVTALRRLAALQSTG